MKANVKEIKWNIEVEDLMMEFDHEPTVKELTQMKKEIESNLPSEAEVEVDDYDDIADVLSDTYGWLVDSYKIC